MVDSLLSVDLYAHRNIKSFNKISLGNNRYFMLGYALFTKRSARRQFASGSDSDVYSFEAFAATWSTHGMTPQQRIQLSNAVVRNRYQHWRVWRSAPIRGCSPARGT
ncbi:hypothetical protein O9992_21830 [Vibrio lentus]|nr:hypothetical protein [Vibrio lentus]